MKGLILKDFYMATKYCRSFLLVVLVFLGVAFCGNEEFLLYPVMIAGMLPVTLIAYDERERWENYCDTLPVTRAQAVSAKYIMGLIFAFAAWLPAAGVYAFAVSWETIGALSGYIDFISILLSLGLFFPALVLPFIFKFGAEKGRMVYYILIAAICVLIAVFVTSGKEFFRSGQGFSSGWSCLLLIAVSAVVYAVSWFLSAVFYRKREL